MPLAKKSKQWLLILGGLGLLGALLARSLRTNPEWRAFRWRVFLESLLAIDPVWALIAVGSVYLTYLIRALRWRVLMRPLKARPSLWNLLSATVIGFAAIGIFGRAGEMVRPYLVARREGVPVSSQVAVWLVERCFDTLTLLVTASLGLRQLQAKGLEGSPTLTRVLNRGGDLIVVSTLGLLVLLFVLRNFAEPITRWLIGKLRSLHPRSLSAGRLARLEQTLGAFEAGTRGIRNLRTLAGCTLYSAAEWILIAFCCMAVFNCFSGGLRLSTSEVLIFMGSIMLGSLVNIPGVGGGIQVASLLALTELFAVRPETAASISLLIWVFTFLAVVPPALLLMLYEGLNWAKLRNLEAESEDAMSILRSSGGQGR